MKEKIKHRFYLTLLSLFHIIDGIIGIITLGGNSPKYQLSFHLVIFYLKTNGWTDFSNYELKSKK